MRKVHFVMAAVGVFLIGLGGNSLAHFPADGRVPPYPGATPRALCYQLDDDVAKDPRWVSWIDNAATLWNRANTGWTFQKCTTDQQKANPDIRFSFNHGDTKLEAAAQGGKRGGGSAGYWQTTIEPNVAGMTINGVKIVGGVDGKGWRLNDLQNEKTLDPILVMGHELSHAMGLDHAPGGKCDTGNLEEPICPGNHNNPAGRRPSASDVAEVKKGIVAELTAQAAAKAKIAESAPSTNTGSDGGIGFDNPDATVARQPQREERPFLCFGDAACEREMARQKRAVDPMPLRPGSQPRDAGGDEGPVLQDVPGQIFVPGQNGAPLPGGPGF